VSTGSLGVAPSASTSVVTVPEPLAVFSSRQLPSQPSPGLRLPSSHCSLPSTTWLPHTAIVVLVVEDVVLLLVLVELDEELLVVDGLVELVVVVGGAVDDVVVVGGAVDEVVVVAGAELVVVVAITVDDVVVVGGAVGQAAGAGAPWAT